MGDRDVRSHFEAPSFNPRRSRVDTPQRVVGCGRVCHRARTPALAEIEDALVPAFIIEELEDGRFTVFVPSIPTPLAGAVYVLSRDRVHPLDIPFTQAIQTVSRWGSGAKELVAAMQKPSLAEAAGAIST